MDQGEKIVGIGDLGLLDTHSFAGRDQLHPVNVVLLVHINDDKVVFHARKGYVWPIDVERGDLSENVWIHDLQFLLVDPLLIACLVRILDFVLCECALVEVEFIVAHADEPYFDRLRILVVFHVHFEDIHVENINNAWLHLPLKVHEYFLPVRMLQLQPLVILSTAKDIETAVVRVLINKVYNLILHLGQLSLLVASIF